jgi:lipid-binding SYLF domain-containing protein
MASLNYLLQQASGVMVFPQIIRGGFFLGAQAGRGVLTARSEQGEWSSPAFYDMGGGSAGIQVGVQRASMILVFMNKRVLETAVRSGFTMGVDASFSAGSSSVDAAFQSDMVSKDIYYFSNIEGVFAGISLGGRLISPDPQATRTYYSYEENVDQVTPEAIVIQQKFDHAGAMVLKTALKTSAK